MCIVEPTWFFCLQLTIFRLRSDIHKNISSFSSFYVVMCPYVGLYYFGDFYRFSLFWLLSPPLDSPVLILGPLRIYVRFMTIAPPHYQSNRMKFKMYKPFIRENLRSW